VAVGVAVGEVGVAVGEVGVAVGDVGVAVAVGVVVAPAADRSLAPAGAMTSRAAAATAATPAAERDRMRIRDTNPPCEVVLLPDPAPRRGEPCQLAEVPRAEPAQQYGGKMHGVAKDDLTEAHDHPFR
jgi:hypothetical protein